MNNKLHQAYFHISDAVKENINAVAQFYAREASSVSNAQSLIERISSAFSSSTYFVGLIIFVGAWVAANHFSSKLGIHSFDPSPYALLQGILCLNGVLITIAVLVRQNRLAQLEEKHINLSLQVTLLTEQKTTKIIQLLEELRLDLPNVKNRVDMTAEKLTVETDTHAVLDAISAQQTHEEAR